MNVNNGYIKVFFWNGESCMGRVKNLSWAILICVGTDHPLFNSLPAASSGPPTTQIDLNNLFNPMVTHPSDPWDWNCPSHTPHSPCLEGQTVSKLTTHCYKMFFYTRGIFSTPNTFCKNDPARTQKVQACSSCSQTWFLMKFSHLPECYIYPHPNKHRNTFPRQNTNVLAASSVDGPNTCVIAHLIVP